jgi:hypothetical protein
MPPDLVATAAGLIDRARLVVTDHVFDEPGVRTIATEWRLDGVLVRRDVWVSVLKGEAMTGKAA